MEIRSRGVKNRVSEGRYDGKKRTRRREMLRCEQPMVREVHAELSINEGGWGAGRGVRNTNEGSRSRLRLSMPSETTRRFAVCRILISPFRERVLHL